MIVVFTCCKLTRFAKAKDEGDTEADCEEDAEESNIPTDAGKPRDTSRDGEVHRLLADAERQEPGLLALPAPPHSPPFDPKQRAEAAAEAERIIGVRDPRAIFGGGTLAQQKGEFRRLVRLLHPDKGLVSGGRASLALRRVVECHQTFLANR